MALQVYAEMTANGTSLTADSTNTMVGGVDVSKMVECFSLEWSIRVTGTDSGGEKQFSPLRFRKRSSGNTPELWQVSVTGQNISGTFHMFDIDPQNGSTRARFRVVITNAKVVSLSTTSPDTSNPATATMAQYDLVELTPQTMLVIDLIASTEYEWSLKDLK